MRMSSTYRAWNFMGLQTNRVLTWDCSKCCKNISAVMPEKGIPWLLLWWVGVSVLEKWNCFAVAPFLLVWKTVPWCSCPCVSVDVLWWCQLFPGLGCWITGLVCLVWWVYGCCWSYVWLGRELNVQSCLWCRGCPSLNVVLGWHWVF